jgi:hypothetical protein
MSFDSASLLRHSYQPGGCPKAHGLIIEGHSAANVEERASYSRRLLERALDHAESWKLGYLTQLLPNLTVPIANLGLVSAVVFAQVRQGETANVPRLLSLRGYQATPCNVDD